MTDKQSPLPGISLLDYFAGQVAPALIVNPSTSDKWWTAQHAYEFAQAMLDERERRKAGK